MTTQTMTDADLIQRASATVDGYLEIGNEAFDAAGARFVRNRATPRRWDANHIAAVSCADEASIDRLLERADAEYADYPYRRFDTGPLTPPQVLARLAVEGYESTSEVHLLLEADLRANPAACDIRRIENDDGWQAFERLSEQDWEETVVRQGRPLDRSILPEFAAYKRAKAPAVRYFLAYVDGAPVAYFSSWPGVQGIGLVEDLFTQREYRRRGIATALIAHCVADARSRGAGPVLIGADPTDTPMRMYAALGFRPLFLTANYMKQRERS